MAPTFAQLGTVIQIMGYECGSTTPRCHLFLSPPTVPGYRAAAAAQYPLAGRAPQPRRPVDHPGRSGVCWCFRGACRGAVVRSVLPAPPSRPAHARRVQRHTGDTASGLGARACRPSCLTGKCPPQTRWAMSEHGFVGAMFPNVTILDLAGLHDRNTLTGPPGRPWPTGQSIVAHCA